MSPTGAEKLTQGEQQASLERAVYAETMLNGKVVHRPGMSQEEEEIRRTAASFDEDEVRRLWAGRIARGEATTAQLEEHIRFLRDEAEWAAEVVAHLDAQDAAQRAGRVGE
jgi:hypothetical protein